jgi:hypothetical protein
MTFFSNLTRNEIANKLCLTVEGVDKNRLRGIENLIEIVWNFIHKK